MCVFDSKESWPFHNTFKSHLFVYFGEFIHIQWMQLMCSKYWCDYLKIFKISLSLSHCKIEHCFWLFACIWKSVGFSLWLHRTIGNKISLNHFKTILLIWEYIGNDSHTRWSPPTENQTVLPLLLFSAQWICVWDRLFCRIFIFKRKYILIKKNSEPFCVLF